MALHSLVEADLGRELSFQEGVDGPLASPSGHVLEEDAEAGHRVRQVNQAKASQQKRPSTAGMLMQIKNISTSNLHPRICLHMFSFGTPAGKLDLLGIALGSPSLTHSC